MVYPWPDYGCWTWFAPNALADEWARKTNLVKTTWQGKLAYRIEGTPRWHATFKGEHKDWEWPNSCMTKYDDKGRWFGFCQAHSIVYTAILQERTKGGYHIIDGVPLKAVSVAQKGVPHQTTEVYIKSEGYFILDISMPEMIVARSVCSWYTGGLEMGNRFFCTGDWTDTEPWGFPPYKSNWAGEPPPPQKSYINASSFPTGASIWLKKH